MSKYKRYLLIFLLFYLLLNLTCLDNLVMSDESAPIYSVKLTMDEKEIYGEKEVEIGFMIQGIGDIDWGLITVVSDGINILRNSFALEQYKVIQGDWNLTFSFDTTNFGSGVDQFHTGTILPTKLVEDEYVFFKGNFWIDTKYVGQGNYKIIMQFKIKNNGVNYIFEDEISYNKTIVNEKWLPFILTALSSILVSVIIEEVKFRRRKNTNSTSGKPRARKRSR